MHIPSSVQVDEYFEVEVKSFEHPKVVMPPLCLSFFPQSHHFLTFNTTDSFYLYYLNVIYMELCSMYSFMLGSFVKHFVSKCGQLHILAFHKFPLLGGIPLHVYTAIYPLYC